jgi:hypothetical protein
MLDSKKWSFETLKQHSVDMRQFIDARESTLPNGMRIIDVHNSSGLTFTLLPDRGFDIWTAHYKGLPLTWISQGSPHPPDSGQDWLRQFNGGLLTTCGLTHVGPPETDDITGEVRDIHGRYTRQRAEIVEKHGMFHEGEYEFKITGVINEARLFGEQLKLTRTYKLCLGIPFVEIIDRITNMGDMPAPLMHYFHINVGFPLVREGTQLLTTGTVHPRDEAARKGTATWQTFDAPTAGYPEQVFYHHLKSDANDNTTIALLNDDFGLELSWYGDELPYFTQWKNTRQGIYVCAIEPGNCIPEGQNAARKTGRLELLEPGETHTSIVMFSIVEGKDEIENCRKDIAALERDGKLIEWCKLDDYPKI